MTLDLSLVDETVLSGLTKGIPGRATGVRLRDIPDQKWNVMNEDLPLPLLVLRQSALQHNLGLMQRYCDRHGVLFAPHGKTTMAPQLFDAQLSVGAWGITAATVEQVQVYRAFGIERVLLANQVVGAPALRYLAEQLREDPEFEFLSWVDSAEAVRVLVKASEEFRPGRPWRVLLELGWDGGRTGARDALAVREIVATVRNSMGTVELAGVAVFEGLLSMSGIAAQATGGVQVSIGLDEFLARAVETAADLHAAGDLPDHYILTGGGSTSFDAVVRHFTAVPGSVQVIIRPGCYITHDHGMNHELSPLGDIDPRCDGEDGRLRPALEVWAYVHSTPEHGLAFLGLGRRDAPFDAGMPVPLARIPAGSRERQPIPGAEVTGLNDQHCYLRHDGSVSIGDRVVLGISHPCTAFDKWRTIPVTDDRDNVVGAVQTYF